jgi:translocation and assembly module TamA
MSSGTRGRRALYATALVLIFSHAPGAYAQTPAAPGAVPSAPLAVPSADPLDVAIDPAAPLDPMPSIDLDWPDMDAPEPPDPEAQPIDPAAPQVAEAATTDDSAAELRYSVVVEGLDDLPREAEIRSLFAANSALDKNDDDPANAAQLDRRAKGDAALLTEVLRANGYYDPVIATRIEKAPAGATPPNRLQVILTATPGPQYRFSSIALPGLDAAGADAAPIREAFGIDVPDPVIAADVIAAEIALKLELGKRGYPFAKVGERDVVVDHEADAATLNQPVDPNGRRRFGQIKVTGSPPFPPKHVGIIARFEQGEVYSQPLIDDLRRALIATGLIATAQVTPTPTDDPELVDINVALTSAPLRTIAGEAGYGTGEGFRVEGSWQHRNFFNPEGALTVRGIAGTQEQLLSASLRRNNFRRRDQILTAQIAASNLNRDAFRAKTFTLAAGIERQTNIIWQKKWVWSVGAELIASDERDTIGTTSISRRRTFFIGALPTSLGYDGSDDLLDPKRGFRLSGRLSPEASFQGSAFGYVRSQIDGSVYFPFREDKIVIASRARIGSIAGAGRDRIAPSRRFYAGGGGSVRGYGFQRIGPLDANNDPIGGRSLAEFSLEGRIRLPYFGGNFGVVPFIDAGTISTSLYPRIGDLRVGAGVGLRYYSNFGPIRIDVGAPLNPRKGDSPVAVYVSLGQAF